MAHQIESVHFWPARRVHVVVPLNVLVGELQVKMHHQGAVAKATSTTNDADGASRHLKTGIRNVKYRDFGIIQVQLAESPSHVIHKGFRLGVDVPHSLFAS